MTGKVCHSVLLTKEDPEGVIQSFVRFNVMRFESIVSQRHIDSALYCHIFASGAEDFITLHQKLFAENN